MMDIGILECGHVRKQFVEEHGQYPQMFSDLLKTVAPSLTFATYDVEHDQWPTHMDECQAYLITGSPHGVNDGFPWIAKLETFIRALHAKQKKLIGICFGHQLIAKALGGRVIRAPNGWGVGMSQNHIIVQKPWMTPNIQQFNLLNSHQDQVVELPDHAEVLASNDFCPIYMCQMGECLTIQGHPEFSKAYSKALIEMRRDQLDRERYEAGLHSLQLDKNEQIIAQWIIHFLNQRQTSKADL